MKKKKILIISPIPSGLNLFFLEGKEEFTGMPAFKEVFIKLLNDERLEKMYLFLFVNKAQMGKIVIPDRYKEKVILSTFFYDRANPIKSIFSLFLLIVKGMWTCFTKGIFKIGGFRSHGGSAAGIIGLLTRTYNTRRIYGTFLINELDTPKWKLFIRHPLEYLCYIVPGGSLLITNDGTRGNLVYNKIGSKSVKFTFPLNGIDKKIEEKLVKPAIELPDQYICYVARIADWKRQHLLAEALGILKKNGVAFPKCYIVGPISHQDYLEKLKQSIKDNKLEEEVTIIPGLPAEQSNYLIKNSVLTFSLYHTSNLGNVFIESIALGAPMVAINDTGSLAQFPEDIYIPVKSSLPEDVAKQIEVYLGDQKKREIVSQKAKQYAIENFKSWPQRASLEVNELLS